MKKGQTYEGVVKSISFSNKGRVETITENGTETAIVKGSFLGQKIKYYVNKKKGRKGLTG